MHDSYVVCFTREFTIHNQENFKMATKNDIISYRTKSMIVAAETLYIDYIRS